MGRTRAGNTGANKQPGLLSVRGALVRCGAQVREGEKGNEEGGGGTTHSQGIELRVGEVSWHWCLQSLCPDRSYLCAWFAVSSDTAMLCFATYGLFIQTIKHRAV